MIPVTLRAPAPCGDRSVALILFLLLALVFAPIFGLHVALSAFSPPAASDGVAAASSPPSASRG